MGCKPCFYGKRAQKIKNWQFTPPRLLLKKYRILIRNSYLHGKGNKDHEERKEASSKSFKLNEDDELHAVHSIFTTDFHYYSVCLSFSWMDSKQRKKVQIS